MSETTLEDNLWERIFERGRQTAVEFGITSEDDVERIIDGE